MVWKKHRGKTSGARRELSTPIGPRRFARTELAEAADFRQLAGMRIAFALASFCLVALLAPAQAGESFQVAAFSFTTPEGWTKVEPSSPMRNAQLEIARGAEKAEVTFFHFGGGSGEPGG